MDNRIKVINAEGLSGSVPEEDLYYALADEGYTLVDPMQPVHVWTKDGHSGTIPAEDLVEAIKSRNFSIQPVVEPDSAFVDEAKRAGKAVGRAGLNLADLPSNILGMLQQGAAARAMSEYDDDLYDDMMHPTPEQAAITEQYNIGNHLPSDALKEAGLNLEHNDTTPGQRGRSHIYETMADFVGGGALGKLAKLAKAPKLGTFLGGDQSLKNLATTGAGVGATAQGLQETGVNPFVSELVASVAAPTAGGLLSRLPKDPLTKAQLYPIGLSPSKFNLEAAEAAKRSGIDLTAAAYTDSRIMHHLQGLLSKSPHFGDIMTAKNTKATEQTKNRIRSILDKVGPEDTEEVRKEISARFNRASDRLPQDATVQAQNTVPYTGNILDKYKNIGYLEGSHKALNDIAQDVHGSFTAKPQKAAVAAPDNSMEALYERANALHELPSSTTQGVTTPIAAPINELPQIPVKDLITQKQVINGAQKLWRDDYDVINEVRNIGRNIGSDIETYGLTDPHWYKDFQGGNKLHGQVQQRNKLENIFSKASNEGTDTIGYGNLSKLIHDKKSAKKIKKIVGTDEGIKEVKDLGETAKAASRKNLNVLNPSGTTTTALAAASGYGTLKGLMADPVSTLLALGATKRATSLLTDQKYVDKAIKYAKEAKTPKAPLLPEIAQRIKKTGAYTPALIAKEKQEEERRKKLPTITVRTPGNRNSMPEIDLPSVGR